VDIEVTDPNGETHTLERIRVEADRGRLYVVFDLDGRTVFVNDVKAPILADDVVTVFLLPADPWTVDVTLPDEYDREVVEVPGAIRSRRLADVARTYRRYLSGEIDLEVGELEADDIQPGR